MNISKDLKFDKINSVIACSWDDVDYELSRLFEKLEFNSSIYAELERSENQFLITIDSIQKDELINLLEVSNIGKENIEKRNITFEDYIEEIYSEDDMKCCFDYKEDNYKIISALYKELYKTDIEIIESLCNFEYFAVVVSQKAKIINIH